MTEDHLSRGENQDESVEVGAAMNSSDAVMKHLSKLW
jgi:hypothetical protein